MIEYFEQKIKPAEFNALREEAGWDTYDDEAIEEGLNSSLFSIVVYDSGILIGMGRVIGDNKIDFFIKDIIVKREYQNKHIGTEIMKRILGYIQISAINNANIGLMSAVGKEGFYRKFGFVERPNETQGCGMNMKIGKKI